MTGKEVKERIIDFFYAYKKGLIIIFFIAFLVVLANFLGVDKWIITGGVVIISFLTQAFTVLLSIVSLVPVIGPIIVNVISLPFFLILNGLGYLVTFLAFRKGSKQGEDTKHIMKQAFLSRIITTAVLVGIVIGFILGRLI